MNRHDRDSWVTQANCRDADLNLFFPEAQIGTAKRKDAIRQAQRICSRCPVLLECRDYAVRAGEKFGIWAGVDINGRGGKERIKDSSYPVRIDRPKYKKPKPPSPEERIDESA